jgi:hypothetical protein
MQHDDGRRIGWRSPETRRFQIGAPHGYAYADSVVGVDGTALGAYLTGLALIQCLVVVATPIALKAAVDGLASRRGARLVAATALRAHGERLAGGVAVAVGALFLAAGIA